MNHQIHNIRSRYSDRATTGTRNEEHGKRAQQHFANEVNINEIMEKAKMGQMPRQRIGHLMPKYGDFSGITSYQDAVMQIDQAKQLFMTMPAKIRDHFDNNPAKLIAFCQNAGNLAEGIELGLFDNPEPEVRVGDSPKPNTAPQAPQPPQGVAGQ